MVPSVRVSGMRMQSSIVWQAKRGPMDHTHMHGSWAVYRWHGTQSASAGMQL